MRWVLLLDFDEWLVPIESVLYCSAEFRFIENSIVFD